MTDRDRFPSAPPLEADPAAPAAETPPSAGQKPPSEPQAPGSAPGTDGGAPSAGPAIPAPSDGEVTVPSDGEVTVPSDDGEERSVRSILRGVRLGAGHEVDLLGGVQRRIRERSRGRFYRDGWSRGSPTSTHVLTSLLMLVILLLVYFVLLPGVRFR